MLNAFKARMLSSVALLSTPRLERELAAAMARVVYKLILPGTVGAGYLDCLCMGPKSLVANCPYHGRAARRLARG